MWRSHRPLVIGRAVYLPAIHPTNNAYFRFIDCHVKYMKQRGDESGSVSDCRENRPKSRGGLGSYPAVMNVPEDATGHSQRGGSRGGSNRGTVDIAACAWGPDPGMWPLPAVDDARDRWYRAVAAGGQGRYSAGVAQLDSLSTSESLSEVLRSSIASTRASWLRQVGSHEVAARFDGIAVASVGLGEAQDPSVLEAQCDALTGLAADRLGVGRFAESDSLLTRCESILDRDERAPQLWRCRLRARWVRAELAMMSGEGASAVRYALDARELATDIVSLRHRIKTDLVLGAAYCSIGDVDRGRDAAYEVLDACAEAGLVPLRWAAAMLLGGLGDTVTASPIIDECSATLARRGAHFADV